ncbi:MAG TPA: glycosyltransferase family 4 protein [Longimicrobium sp.]|nr:glycosyltransferase family 4 protein [Longimicrobium sp.]
MIASDGAAAASSSSDTKPAWLVAAGDFVVTGGMDAANHALASYLARSGRETHLVAHRVAPDLAALPDIRVHFVPRPLGSHLLGFPLLARTASAESRRLQMSGRPRVTLANGGNFGGWATWLHYVHAAYQPEIAGQPLRRAIQHAAARKARRDERAVASHARVVIANSALTARHAAELLGAAPERVHVVYYGADPERFRPPSPDERNEARAALGLADDAPALVFVGALGDRRKGFDMLFRAFASLATDAGWDATLLVVGAGGEMEAWKRRAGEAGLDGRIRFLGFQQDVRRVLFACDAIVAPTRYEAYGLAVQEAICCGLPAIVSRAAGVAERIPAPLGALLPGDADDAGELAAKLRAWRSGVDAHRAAALELSKMLRGWTWDHMAARIVDIVESRL